MLVNKSLLLLWFTAFLRTLRADFSTLLWLWGTADTVEPAPSCKRPPKAWEAAGSILCGSRCPGKNTTWDCSSRRGRDAQKGLIRVQSTFGTVLWEPLRSGPGCGEGRQPSAAGQAGRAGAGREGKGEAGRLGCETGLASGSLGELQPASHVPCAPAFLSHGRENLVFFLSPWVNEASVHGGPAVKPLTTQMDTEWCAIDSYKLSVLILEREGWWLNTLSSFTWHLHAKVSCTWCLLVLENGIVTSVWHWA